MSKVILTESQAKNAMSNGGEINMNSGWIIMETILSLKDLIPEEKHNHEVNPNLEYLEQGSRFNLNSDRGVSLWQQIRQTFPHVNCAFMLYNKVPNRARTNIVSNGYAVYLDSYYFNVDLNIKKTETNDEGKPKYTRVPGTLRISNHGDRVNTFASNESNVPVEIDGKKYKFGISIVFQHDGPGFGEPDRGDNDYKIHIFEYKPMSMRDADLSSLIKDVLTRDVLRVGPGELIDPIHPNGPLKFKELSSEADSIFKGFIDKEKRESEMLKNGHKDDKPAKEIVEPLSLTMPDDEEPHMVRFVRMVPKNSQLAFVLMDKDTTPIKARIISDQNPKTPSTMYMPVNITKDKKLGKEIMSPNTERGYYVSVLKEKVVGIGLVNGENKGMLKATGNNKYKVGMTI